ncbi:MAG: hypothetical protein OEV94_05870 [Deltaproteobacteria bacterium]|nr:hypothetical protein [Deltaproteobacteria bacterium]
MVLVGWEVITLAVGACHAGPVSPPAVASHPWAVEFVVSGGIDGRQWRLTLDHQGNCLVENQKRGIKKTATVSQAWLAQADEQVTLLWASRERGKHLPKKNPENRLTGGWCRDCLTYRLVLRDRPEGETQDAWEGQVEQPGDQPERKLVGMLMGVMEETLR